MTDILRYPIPVLHSPNNMIVITSLPSKPDIILAGKTRHSLFEPSYHHTQSRPFRRRLLRRMYTNNGMHMVRHHYGHHDLRIGIMRFHSCQGINRKPADGRIFHLSIYNFTQIMLFSLRTDSNEIFTPAVIVKISPRTFAGWMGCIAYIRRIVFGRTVVRPYRHVFHNNILLCKCNHFIQTSRTTETQIIHI